MTAVPQPLDKPEDEFSAAGNTLSSPPVVSLAMLPVVVPIRQEPVSTHLPDRAAVALADEPLVDDSHLPLYERRITVLPSGWLFSGQIHTDDPINLNCQVVGDVMVSNGRPCVLEPESHVDGTVHASALNMYGKLNGTVNAVGGKVVIHPTAQVHGELRYTNIEMLGGVHHLQLVYAENQP